MAADQVIIGVYAGLMAANICLLSLLIVSERQRYYGTGLVIWLGFLLSFIANGAIDRPDALLGLLFCIAFIISYFTLRLCAFLFRFELPLNRYLALMGVTGGASLVLYAAGANFFWTAFAPAVGAGLPLIHGAWTLLRAEDRVWTLPERMFIGVIILMGVHQLDYPFLRFYEGLVFAGFGVGMLLAYFLSVLLPLMISKRHDADYSDRLAAEVAHKTSLLFSKNQELSEAVEKQERYHKKYRNLVRVLCHDISNPLSVINVLAKRGSRDIGGDLFERLNRAAGVISSIIRHIREGEAVTSGKKEISLEAVDLASALDSARFLFDPMARDKGVDLSFVNEARATPVAETISLSNVVVNNLVSNAIKFSRSGDQVEVKTWDEEGHVCLSVQDQGIGITPDILAKLFDGGSSTSRKGTSGEAGTGFGLPLVAAYVEEYGGEILVESSTDDEAHGTTMTVRLKRADAVADAPLAAPSPAV